MTIAMLDSTYIRKLEDPIEPFHRFLDRLDYSRDLIKEELKGKLLGLLREKETLIANIILREVKKQDGKAAARLNSIVIPLVKQIAFRYAAAAYETGKQTAGEVVKRINRINKQQTKKEKDLKTIKLKNGEVLTAAINSATDSYVVNSTQVLSSMLLSGITGQNARDRIQSDVRNNTREIQSYFRQITDHSQSYIFQTADTAMQEAFAFKDIQNNMRWVTFFTKSCPDCIDRHNRVQSFDAWESEGTPRSGVTVCRMHCHCVLVPAEYPVDVASPVKRERARIEPAGKERITISPRKPAPERKPKKPLLDRRELTIEKLSFETQEAYKRVLAKDPRGGNIIAFSDIHKELLKEFPGVTRRTFLRNIIALSDREVLDVQGWNNIDDVRNPNFIINIKGEFGDSLLAFANWRQDLKKPKQENFFSKDLARFSVLNENVKFGVSDHIGLKRELKEKALKELKIEREKEQKQRRAFSPKKPVKTVVVSPKKPTPVKPKPEPVKPKPEPKKPVKLKPEKRKLEVGELDDKLFATAQRMLAERKAKKIKGFLPFADLEKELKKELSFTSQELKESFTSLMRVGSLKTVNATKKDKGIIEFQSPFLSSSTNKVKGIKGVGTHEKKQKTQEKIKQEEKEKADKLIAQKQREKERKQEAEIRQKRITAERALPKDQKIDVLKSVNKEEKKFDEFYGGWLKRFQKETGMNIDFRKIHPNDDSFNLKNENRTATKKDFDLLDEYLKNNPFTKKMQLKRGEKVPINAIKNVIYSLETLGKKYGPIFQKTLTEIDLSFDGKLASGNAGGAMDVVGKKMLLNGRTYMQTTPGKALNVYTSGIFTHEMGHAIHGALEFNLGDNKKSIKFKGLIDDFYGEYYLGANKTSGFDRRWTGMMLDKLQKKQGKTFITDYARATPLETIAETFLIYENEPERLKRKIGDSAFGKFKNLIDEVQKESLDQRKLKQ